MGVEFKTIHHVGHFEQPSGKQTDIGHMMRSRHGQTCASSLCDKDRWTDDVDSTVKDKLINKSSMLIDGHWRPRGHQVHQVPEIRSMIATTERHMTRTLPDV
jgi:hypothetical protein